MSTATLDDVDTIIDLERLLDDHAPRQCEASYPDGTRCTNAASWLMINSCGCTGRVCSSCRALIEAAKVLGVIFGCAAHGAPVEITFRWEPLT